MSVVTLEQRIKRHEGYTHVPKPDSQFKGNSYVIGFGHDITADQAKLYVNGISEADAEALLEKDIANAKSRVAQTIPWALQLPPLKQDILTEMVFQMGIDGLFAFKNFLFHARSGDDAAAAHAMLDSLWHRETPDRCEEMANLWLNGEGACK